MKPQVKHLYSLLKLPLPVVQRAHLSGFQPARDTVEMESMLWERKTTGQRWGHVHPYWITGERKEWTPTADGTDLHVNRVPPPTSQANVSSYVCTDVCRRTLLALFMRIIKKCRKQVWRLTLQTPQATVHSSDVAEAWLAWHSIPDEINVST